MFTMRKLKSKKNDMPESGLEASDWPDLETDDKSEDEPSNVARGYW